MGIYGAITRWLGDKWWLRPVVTDVLPKVDTALLHHGWHITAFPTLLLTTTGVHSGNPHETPLWYTRDENTMTVVASNYGRREPDWSRNLMVQPRCTVTVGTHSFVAHARVAEEGDAARRFAEFVAFYPTYRDYAERAGRRIRVWILETPPDD